MGKINEKIASLEATLAQPLEAYPSQREDVLERRVDLLHSSLREAVSLIKTLSTDVEAALTDLAGRPRPSR